MRALLDTHVWLWSLAEPARLKAAVQDLIADPSTVLFLSAASAWEIAIKFSLGKLPLPEPPAQYVASRMAAQRIEPLAVSHAHALAVATLPPHHTDPFDRLLVAQSQIEGLHLVTADPRMRPYAIQTIWAS